MKKNKKNCRSCKWFKGYKQPKEISSSTSSAAGLSSSSTSPVFPRRYLGWLKDAGKCIRFPKHIQIDWASHYVCGEFKKKVKKL
jgi:hypothetical protein